MGFIFIRSSDSVVRLLEDAIDSASVQYYRTNAVDQSGFNLALIGWHLELTYNASSIEPSFGMLKRYSPFCTRRNIQTCQKILYNRVPPHRTCKVGLLPASTFTRVGTLNMATQTHGSVVHQQAFIFHPSVKGVGTAMHGAKVKALRAAGLWFLDRRNGTCQACPN